MNLKNRKNKISIFIRYYLMFLAVMCSIFIVNYVIVYDTMVNTVVKDSNKDIENGAQIIDEQLKIVQESFNMLYGNINTVHLSKLKNINTNNYVELQEYQKLLKTAVPDMSMIANYYMIFNDSGVIFDGERIYENFDELYGNFLNYNNFNKEEIMKKLLSNKEIFLAENTVTMDGRKKDVLTFINSSMLSNNLNVKTIILIDINEIKNVLKLNNKYEASKLALLFNDKVIYGDPKVASLSTTKNTVEKINFLKPKILIDYTSNYFNLQYKLLVPNSFITSLLYSFIEKYIFILLLSAIAGISALSLIYVKTTKPYYKIKKEMEMQEPVIKNYYINRVLNPTLSEADMAEAAKYLGIQKDSSGFVCVIEKADEGKDSESFIYEIINILNNSFSSNTIITYINKIENRLIILLSSIPDYNEGVKELLSIIETLIIKHDIKMNIGIGNEYEDIRGFSVSFGEANKVIEQCKVNNLTGIYAYNDLPKADQTFIVDSENENKLQMLILTGQKNKAVNAFLEIFERFYNKENIINKKSINIFMCGISNILIKCVNSVINKKESQDKIIEEISLLTEINHPEKLRLKVSSIIENICSFVADKKKSNNKKLIEDIIHYIDENYHDYNLGLSVLSEAFDRNERYLSQFFKQQKGINFAQYLEMVRMKKATELLEETDTLINDIVTAVGYCNRNTFYKAFIRVHGINPSEYRENLRGNLK